MLSNTNLWEVLGAAVITLNGKPTKGSDFGKKVEFAMGLVSYKRAMTQGSR